MSYQIENVLVIRRSLFDELGAFQGLNFEPEKYLKAILSRGSNFFVGRSEGGKTRSDDHRADISSKKRIACASRNHGDMVADLRGFARPFTAVARFPVGSGAVS